MKLSFGVWPAVCSAALLAALTSGSGCAAAPKAAVQAVPATAEANVAAPPPTDSTPDAPPPFHLIEFFGIGRGDRVADLGPGKGYSIVSLSDAVGPFGAVYVRHAPTPLQALQSDSTADAPQYPTNVIRMDAPANAPLSEQATNLDCATLLFAYHDLVAEGRDRKKFNTAVLRALKPGGLYFVAEHATVPGAGPGAARDASRVDARIVQAEVEAAGFRFVEAADFQPPSAQLRAGTERAASSQYVLKFQKPR